MSVTQFIPARDVPRDVKQAVATLIKWTGQDSHREWIVRDVEINGVAVGNWKFIVERA